jgi:ubiquinone/menaquinone biosynthesis C-methylase UbiE
MASAIISLSMDWLTLPRKPESEVMAGGEEVAAYASAAAQRYLDAIDNTLVEQVLAVGAGGGEVSGWLLDIGTGPGGIPLKLARLCPKLRVVGIDQSANMIQVARRASHELGLADRALFFVGDANRLCFPDARFDFVLANSVLHHLREPVAAFNEMGRVAKPGGVVLVRDLRRPSRLALAGHVRWYGRHYFGTMKKLYSDSVRAAYTGEELEDLLRRSTLAGARIFFHGRTHLGFIRGGRNGGRPKGRTLR